MTIHLPAIVYNCPEWIANGMVQVCARYGITLTVEHRQLDDVPQLDDSEEQWEWFMRKVGTPPNGYGHLLCVDFNFPDGKDGRGRPIFYGGYAVAEIGSDQV